MCDQFRTERKLPHCKSVRRQRHETRQHEIFPIESRRRYMDTCLKGKMFLELEASSSRFPLAPSAKMHLRPLPCGHDKRPVQLGV